MRNTYIWLGFAIALAVIVGFVVSPSVTVPAYAGQSEMDNGPEDGSGTGMGDPDMPDTGKDPNTTQGSLAFERVDSGRKYGLNPQAGMTDVTQVAAEPQWKLWLRALGVLFGTRIGWF
jgi:hypothetical protein